MEHLKRIRILIIALIAVTIVLGQLVKTQHYQIQDQKQTLADLTKRIEALENFREMQRPNKAWIVKFIEDSFQPEAHFSEQKFEELHQKYFTDSSYATYRELLKNPIITGSRAVLVTQAPKNTSGDIEMMGGKDGFYSISVYDAPIILSPTVTSLGKREATFGYIFRISVGYPGHGTPQDRITNIELLPKPVEKLRK